MSLMERFEKLLRQGVPVDLATELTRLELANVTRPAVKQQDLFPAPKPPAQIPQVAVEPPTVQKWSARAEVAAGINKVRAAHGTYLEALKERQQAPVIDSSGRKERLAHQNFNRARRLIYVVAKEEYEAIQDSCMIVTLARVKGGGLQGLSKVMQAKGFTCSTSDVEAWEDGYRLPVDAEVVAMATLAGLEVDYCVQTVRRGREVIDEYRAQLGMCKVYRVSRRAGKART
jgi:hypothetical protein